MNQTKLASGAFLFLVLLFILMAFFSCSEAPADLNKAEQLTARGFYRQAEEVLKEALNQSYSDTLQYARIRNRLKILHRLRFFKTLDSLILSEKWSQASALWEKLNSALRDSTEKTRNYYGFTLFHYKSRIDSALGKTNAYWNGIRKSLRFSTVKIPLIRLKYEQLGLHLAEQDSLTEARAMFDRSLRKLRVARLSPALKQIYFDYMDGRFVNCLHTLKMLPDSLKDTHWKNMQFFLDTYGKALTMDERFKLW